jgi:hypothetical protein
MKRCVLAVVHQAVEPHASILIAHLHDGEFGEEARERRGVRGLDRGDAAQHLLCGSECGRRPGIPGQAQCLPIECIGWPAHLWG